MQNIQNMQNNQNMSNMSNMLNMHKNTVLVHKIVYLALHPLFLVWVSRKQARRRPQCHPYVRPLGVVLVPAAAAGEGMAGAAGAEVSERPPRRCFIEHIPLGEVSWVHRRGRRGEGVVDLRCGRKRYHRGTGGGGTGSGGTFIIIRDTHAWLQPTMNLMSMPTTGCRVRFVRFFVQPHDICAKHLPEIAWNKLRNA